jgi:hypothetical protein
VLLINHVLSGALIGALARRPLTAFAAGAASHFVLDAVPHWGGWDSRRRFLRVAVPDGLISLAAVNRFHAGIQREASRRLYVELLAAGGLTAAALTALRRSRGRSGGRSAGTPAGGGRLPR